MGGACEEEQPNSYAAWIEARDERRNRAGRHEGSCSRDIANRLCHGLLHVGAFTKAQLHQGGTLNALAIDRLNTRDVKKVVLVVIGEKAFHLGGSHAAIGLRYVYDRVAHLREDIRSHSA